MIGALAGPVRWCTSRARSEDEGRDEVEDGIDERVGGKHAQQAIDDGAAGCLADSGRASISPPLVIAANSPAIAEALRVTTSKATTSGPTSRVANQPIASALTDSAPYCLS